MEPLVELIEYLLVFGVTTAVAALSILVLAGFLPTLHQTQSQSELDQISGAAGLAAQNGSATLLLSLDNASVTCSGGNLRLTTDGSTYSSEIGASCDFSAADLNGLCRLIFTRTSDGVTMEAYS